MGNISLCGGELFIKPEGEAHYKRFGTTDSFSVSTEIEKKEHINTESAIPSVDCEVITKQSASLKWDSADMSAEMMAFAFRGVIENTRAVTKLTFEQIDSPCILQTEAYGASEASITGLVKGEDFTYNPKSGLIEILNTSKVVGKKVDITFVGAKSGESFYAFKNAKTVASLVFISDAASGNAFKYEFFKVNITQDGDLAIKGDDFLKVSFSGSVLKDDQRAVGEQFFKITKL